MADEPTISDRQAEYLEERLGIKLLGSQEVANDVFDYLVERSEEEGLGADELYMVAQAVADRVEEAYAESAVESLQDAEVDASNL